MSSTNRGATRERDDFYETPAWATKLVLPVLGGVAGRVVLDPFAGRGAILDVCTEEDACETLAFEKDPDRARMCSARNRTVRCADTFEAFSPGDFGIGGEFHAVDLIVTNVPFSRALEAVKWCIATGRPTAVLLRLAFLASLERAAFHRKHPADVFVLARRPSFLTREQKKRLHEEALARWRESGVTHDKRPTPPGTDSCDYAWFVWGRDGGRWEVLG